MARKGVSPSVPAGFTLRRTLRGGGSVVLALAWSPDGRTLAAGAQDGAVRLWDERGAHRAFATRSSVVTGIAWSPDGRSLATTTGEPAVKLWRVATGALA